VSSSGKKSPKNPRFFCEDCEAEVPRDAKKCPKCGRNFASVRCPSCDFTGEESFFKGGCPVCGYSANTTANTREFPKKAQKKFAGALPLWVYILTTAAFTATLAAIFLWFYR